MRAFGSLAFAACAAVVCAFFTDLIVGLGHDVLGNWNLLVVGVYTLILWPVFYAIADF